MPRKDLVRVRRGTSTEWASANPVLADGEPGLDTTLDQVKYGDGVTAWNALSWENRLRVTVDPVLEGLTVHYGPGPLPPPGTMPNTLYVLIPS